MLDCCKAIPLCNGFSLMDAAVNPGTGANHSSGLGELRRRCTNCRINSGIPTRSKYGMTAPITTIWGPSNPPTRLNNTANGVATAIATHNPLRQDPTTPLKRRCASNPISKPPRKNRISPDSMAGIANSNSAGFQESMESTGGSTQGSVPEPEPASSNHRPIRHRPLHGPGRPTLPPRLGCG